MNGPLDAENLEAEIYDHRVSLEPGYLGFLRSQGYQIDELLEAHTVKSPGSELAHLVLKVQTYDKPKDHPDLDVVADKIGLFCCDCWSWRNSSADVREGEPPSSCGTCKHVRQISKVANALNDDNQSELL